MSGRSGFGSVLELSEQWLLDQQRCFCAGYLIGVGSSGYAYQSREQLNKAAAFIAKMNEAEIEIASDATLGILVDLPDRIAEPDPITKQASVSIQRILAKDELARRHGARRRREVEGGSRSAYSVILTHLVMLLRDEAITFEKVLLWFAWNDSAHQDGVNKLLSYLKYEGSKSYERIEELICKARDGKERIGIREIAIDDIFSIVASTLVTLENSGTKNGLGLHLAWWTRTCLAWRTALYFWPLMVGGSGNARHGISLPVVLLLRNGGNNKVNISEHDALKPDMDWNKAFLLGLTTASALWKTQNGRFFASDRSMAEDMFNSDLEVDLSVATNIIEVVHESDHPYRLNGRSAELYWALSVLGLLTKDGEIPSGVATGMIKERDGYFGIEPVHGITWKLDYANSHGFSRVVVPGEEEELLAEQADGDMSMVEDESQGATLSKGTQNYLKFRNRLKALDRELRIEVNLCLEVRSAADALLTRNWRRANFIRLPETQLTFGFHLRRFFALGEKPENLTKENRKLIQRYPWKEMEGPALQEMDDLLLGDDRSPVRIVERTDVQSLVRELNHRQGEIPNQIEAAMGKWLAWRDHRKRSGSEEPGSCRLPGLSVLALKNAKRDTYPRLWAAIADVLDVAPSWYRRFRLRDPQLAVIELEKLINNIALDPRISQKAPPDLILLFDNEGLVKQLENVRYPEQFDSGWMHIFNPRHNNPFANQPLLEALSDQSNTLLGVRGCRVLIISGERESVPSNLSQKNLSAEQYDLLERLAVFRFGFSAQAAFYVARVGKKVVDANPWSGFLEILDALVKDKQCIRFTKGQYFIRSCYLDEIRDNSQYWSDPHMHLAAARSLSPLLLPTMNYRANNRDKSLMPENSLEAAYHLSEAIAALSPKDRLPRNEAKDGQRSLALLHRYPDWDTVGILKGSSLAPIAFSLGRDLIEQEKVGQEPSTAAQLKLGPRIGLLFDMIRTQAMLLSRRNKLPGKSDATRAKPFAEMTALKMECHNLFDYYADQFDEMGIRLARRISSQYLQAIRACDEAPRSIAVDLIEEALDDIERDDFLDADEERVLNVSMLTVWWEQEIKSERNHRRKWRLARLAMRTAEVRNRKTTWDVHDYFPWVYFLSLSERSGRKDSLAEAVGLWKSAVCQSSARRNEFTGRLLRRSERRANLRTLERTKWNEKLHLGGLALARGVMNPNILSSENANIAVDYLASVNLADRSLAFDLIKEWSNMPWDWLEWAHTDSARRCFATRLMSNTGAWVAILDDANQKRRKARVIKWLKARRDLDQIKSIKVDPTACDALNQAELKIWKNALIRGRTLREDLSGALGKVLEAVLVELEEDIDECMPDVIQVS